MQVVLPPPKTWDDFEVWSKKVIEKIRPDITFNIYGRQGQKQFGIDIISISQTEKIAVQCKNVDTLNEKMINDELRKLSEYDGLITTYYIFTTVSRDARILDFLQKINTHIQVDLKFWEDIAEIIRENSDLMTAYCMSVNIDINEYSFRVNDVKIIKEVMGTMHTPTLNNTLQEMPKYIDAYFLGVYQEMFNTTVLKYDMYIHDEKLKSLFNHVKNNMEEMFRVGIPYYNLVGDKYIFHTPGDFFMDKESEQAYGRIDELRKIVYKKYHELHEYIRQYYPEVNLLELSENARQELLRGISEINF